LWNSLRKMFLEKGACRSDTCQTLIGSLIYAAHIRNMERLMDEYELLSCDD